MRKAKGCWQQDKEEEKKNKKKEANYEHLSTYSSHTSTSSNQQKPYLYISAFSEMDERIERMKQVAERGDVNAFYQLIGEDVKLLEHIDQLPFVQTPLHIAACTGNNQFAMEMMVLKPSFAWKLNPDRFSPIHLALQNRNIKLVRKLLQFDGDLVRVKGREHITPLHYVVANSDNVDLLDKFLLVCPNSIADVTMQNETALHIALKNDNLEAFKFLVGWLGRNCSKNGSFNEKAVLNWEDDDGNTVLHIAVSKIETQAAVNHLLTWGFGFIHVNHRNSEGKTAWDIFEGQTQVDNNEIRILLHNAGASSGSSLSAVTRSYYNDIDEFYNLIGEDVKLLEHIDELPFVNTPLHIAASIGNIQFAKEMINLKPSFARKLNQNGFSPIHVALQNGHIELVRQLLQFDGDLVRVKGRECLTPLHYVLESGRHLDLLHEFLSICPDSILDVTGRNETALHIALKYNMLEIFESFMIWLGLNLHENAKFYQGRVLNWKDNEGNTVLHIAVSKNQTEAVRQLLAWGYKFVDVNQKNIEGKTAWDILQGQTQVDNSVIRVMLRDAKAKPASSLSTFNCHPNIQRLATLKNIRRLAYFLRRFVHWITDINREMRNLTEERRNILLMVTVLLATLSFQAVLTPPRGLWQDNGKCVNLTEVLGSSHHNGSNHLTPFNITTVGSSNHPVIMHLIRSNTTLACEHKAGTAVALEDPLFALFLFCSSSTFTLSNALMVLLAINGQMKFLFFGLHLTLSLSYCYSVGAIMDDLCSGILSAIYSAEFLLLALFISWKLLKQLD